LQRVAFREIRWYKIVSDIHDYYKSIFLFDK
jgi:hypothetical protein